MFSPSEKVNANRTYITIPLDKPEISLSEKHMTDPKQHIKPATLNEQPWNTFTIKQGNTLSSLFSNAGFNDKTMYEVIGKNRQNKQITNIYPGEKISFLSNNQQQLSSIKLARSPIESLLFTKQLDGHFEHKIITRQPEVQIAYAEGKIDSSLFLAGDKAGLSQAQIMELATIFGWDIDFILDIRSGDQFNLIYEELYLDGEKYKNGKILAANFFNQGKEYSAVLFHQKDGSSNYFTPEGKSMRKAFIRTPVDFARISSRFSLNRKHPVLHRIRAHKGTDYAAARGTPIKATGDGKISHLGRKGGYGRAVVIQHGQSISTLYAHMSRYAKGLKKGSRVKQGQIIGYIGSSGLATGPHLHYEFRVNGVQRDSLKVKLPHARPIPKDELISFKLETSTYLAQLSTFNSSFQLAVNH